MRRRRTFETNIGRDVPRHTDGTIHSSFLPGLRLRSKPVHEVSRTIKHTGWYVDEDQGETIHGIVFALPHGRGFLAGYSSPWEETYYSIEPVSYSTAFAAAQVADDMARYYAEKEREYQEKECLRQELEELPKEVQLQSDEIRDLIWELKGHELPPHSAMAAREKVKRLWFERRSKQKRIQLLTEQLS